MALVERLEKCRVFSFDLYNVANIRYMQLCADPVGYIAIKMKILFNLFSRIEFALTSINNNENFIFSIHVPGYFFPILFWFLFHRPLSRNLNEIDNSAHYYKIYSD